jgi:WD40 repeat protein
MRWLGQGWRFAWGLLPVFLPFAVLLTAWDFLELRLGSEISLSSFTIGVLNLDFTFMLPHGLAPWSLGLYFFGRVVLVPALWLLALYLGFRKLQGRDLVGGVKVFLVRLFDLIRAAFVFSLWVSLGLLLLVVPGIQRGLAWMFGPLIVLVQERYCSSFTISELITAGNRLRLFLLLFSLAILGEMGSFVAANLWVYWVPAGVTFMLLYRVLMVSLTLGALLAAYVELSRGEGGAHCGLPAVKEAVVQWGRAQRVSGLAAGAVLLGLASYVAVLSIPNINPLAPMPALEVPQLPRTSQEADLILGTETIGSFAPGPREGELTLFTTSGLEIRTLPDFFLVHFTPLELRTTYSGALFPDGEKAVYTGYYGTCLVRLANGEVVWRKDGLQGKVVALSPRGDTVAVGWGSEIVLLEAASGEELMRIVESHPVRWVESVIWRWEEWDEVRMEHLSFDPTGELLVVVLLKEYLQVYSVLRVLTGEVLLRGRGYGTFSPTGELVVVQEQSLSCLDPLTGEKTFTATLPESRGFVVRAMPRVAVSADGRLFAVCGSGNLYLVHRETGTVSHNYIPTYERQEPYWLRLGPLVLLVPWVKSTHSGWCVGLEGGPVFVGDYVVFLNCSYLCLFHADTGKYVRTVYFDGYPLGGPTSPLAIGPRGDTLLLAFGRDDILNLYSLPTGTPERGVSTEALLGFSFPVVKFSPTGEMVAIGEMDGNVEIRSTRHWQQVHLAKGVGGPLGWWLGKVLVLRGLDLSLLDPRTGKVQTTSLSLVLDGRDGWDLGGDKLAVFDHDNRAVRVLDLAAEAELLSARFPDLECVALSPHGELLALGFQGGRVEVRPVGGGEAIYGFALPLGEVEALEFISPQILACGGDDGLVVLELETGRTVLEDRFPGSVFQIEAAGGYLGVVLRSGTVLVYRLRDLG